MGQAKEKERYMIHFSSHYKRLKMRYLKIALLAVIVSIFFMPSFVKFEKTGDNMFTVLLNGKEVGVVASKEDAQKLAVEARRNVASDSNHLVLVESELETVGQEVVWGKVDPEDLVISNMEKVYSSDMQESMLKSYVVKINEKIINLANLDEVTALLQACVNKYDTQQEYRVELQLDPSRELPVMSVEVVSEEDAAKQEEVQQTIAMEAGFHADMSALFEQIEPDVELDFEDYELGIISMDFGDDIEVAEAYLDESELTDISLAINEVTSDEEKNEVYKVVSGDTLSGIAIKTNVPLDKLIEMNDSLEDENSMIRPDDELIVTVEEPMLSVLRSEEMYYEEDYEADVIYIDNDDWYTTQTKVHQQPSAGHRKVVAVVSFENNKQVSEEIIKEEVTYEAVPKIVERGTKIPPTYIKPISGGRLSSNFGYRNRPTKGASSYHKGVDWATPTGTAVYASCGGTVAKAGWGSGYGYVVYINHPDGRQTRYGHLSKVLVSAGQTVSQGQKIALSGNTGVSTGPHLHFEILINGSQVNPLKYLN